MSNFANSTPINKNYESQQLVQQWELHLLLANVKKSIELWFLTGLRAGGKAIVSYDQVLSTCLDVLRHGFQLKCDQTTLSATESRKRALNKLQDDFEWLRRSAQIRDFQEASCSKMMTKTPNIAANWSAFLQNWTFRSLKTNCLRAALEALLSEKDLLEYYYPTTSAFLRNENYATAILICLSALELNQHSLLSQIDAKLYASPVAVMANTARHRRTSSHPNFSISPPKQYSLSLPKTVITKPTSSSTKTAKINGKEGAKRISTFRKVKSLPVLNTNFDKFVKNHTSHAAEPLNRKRSKTFDGVHKRHKNNTEQMTSNNNFLSPARKTATNELQSASNSTLDSDCMYATVNTQKDNLSNVSSMVSAQSDATASTNSSYKTARRIQIINCDDIKIWTDRNWELEQKRQKQQQHHEKSEQKHKSSVPCAIPDRITQAKSISPIHSFLSTFFGTPPGYTAWAVQQQQQQPAVTADLTHDESVTEATAIEDAALILSSNIDDTGITTINNNSSNNNNSYIFGSVFDSFLPTYGQKLRAYSSKSLFENGISYLDYSQPSTSRSLTNANNSSNVQEPISTGPKNCESLMAFLQMSKLTRTNTDLEKENAHFRVSEAIISVVEHIKWARIQAGEKFTANAKKEDDHIPYAEVSGEEEFADQHSAEVVGLTLLSKFNDRQLPKMSELKWLVSEEDAPQALLPLPEYVVRDPDEHFMPSLTRGTKYWAPPRPQIIFTDHPTPNRKKLVLKQNNRCAGCGMVVSSQFVHSFRYCTYLGKYHCTGCHRNQMSATPAKILQFWDFKAYSVCVFAYRLLEQMHACPLFNVADLNPALYERQRSLRTARHKRFKLKFVRDFVKTCRFATREQQYFSVVPEYLTAEPDLWSMNDFFDAYHKSMQRSIDDMIERCENHIFHCVLCTARGFLCEYCRKDEIIYPWQKHVHRCNYCGACYHHKCWKSAGLPAACLRCQRINKRKEDDDIEEELATAAAGN